MEVESMTSAEATVTTETGVAAESEVLCSGSVQADASNDADFGVSTKSVVESDTLVAVSDDCAATTAVNGNAATVAFDKQTTSPSAIIDGGADESTSPPAGDLDPSPAAAPTSDLSLEHDSSFDPSTQWSGAASADTHDVDVAHATSPVWLENDNSADTTTTTNTATTQEDVPRKDDELYSAAEITDEPSPSSNYCHQQEPEPQQYPEQQLPPKEDVHVEDFKAGITCTDVPTAIDVLNTRYRLADVTIHRNMITWSSWNIADIVRGPHRDSFWWRGRRVQQTPVQLQNGAPDSSDDDDERLAQQDVEEVCSKIERREREIALMLDKMDRDAADDVITRETAQRQQQTCPGTAASAQQSAPPPGSNKRGNVFQRLLRALRKRFARQQQQQQQQQTTTLEQQRQHQQAIQRRQRTL